MSIIRIKKEREYVSISNAILQNKKLTWEARGVMAYLLSKPDGWECRNYDLVNQGPASEHVIRRVLKELQGAGYIHRYRKSQGRGKIEWITEIYETPELNTALRNGTFSSVETYETETYDLEKSVDIVSTDSQKVLITEKTDLNAKRQKISGQSKNAVTPIVKAIVQNDGDKRTKLNQLADALAVICKTDIDLASQKIRDDLKTVTLALAKKDITPNVVSDNYKIWWYNNHWLGQKGQPPTPAQIGDTWGQFEAHKETPQVKGHTYTPPPLTEAQKARLAELTNEAK